ncbi:hypothetical protein ILYODFUR_022120 [Ilyodon furcidens]|uniref:Uncharacterized protein n=1 Tax=Ilyodon furcidens TaxID=33524 RepID=A0ABV0UBA6_9TELE
MSFRKNPRYSSIYIFRFTLWSASVTGIEIAKPLNTTTTMFDNCCRPVWFESLRLISPNILLVIVAKQPLSINYHQSFSHLTINLSSEYIVIRVILNCLHCER